MVARRIGDALLGSLMRHEEKRRDQLDAEIAAMLFDTNPDRGRVLTNALVPLGQGFMIPGRLMSDGKARLVVNPAQHVDEAAQEWPDA